MTIRTINDMIAQEVNVCLSSLVTTLAMGFGGEGPARRDLVNLVEQAGELAAPIQDFEEAAIQAGWKINHDRVCGMWNAIKNEASTDDDVTFWCESAQEAAEAACLMDDIEPYDREVFEFWAVSNWLADKLLAKGEKVDTDFAGLNVWARTTTGQAISADYVIEQIYQDMLRA